PPAIPTRSGPTADARPRDDSAREMHRATNDRTTGFEAAMRGTAPSILAHSHVACVRQVGATRPASAAAYQTAGARLQQRRGSPRGAVTAFPRAGLTALAEVSIQVRSTRRTFRALPRAWESTVGRSCF